LNKHINEHIKKEIDKIINLIIESAKVFIPNLDMITSCESNIDVEHCPCNTKDFYNKEVDYIMNVSISTKRPPRINAGNIDVYQNELSQNSQGFYIKDNKIINVMMGATTSLSCYLTSADNKDIFEEYGINIISEYIKVFSSALNEEIDFYFQFLFLFVNNECVTFFESTYIISNQEYYSRIPMDENTEDSWLKVIFISFEDFLKGVEFDDFKKMKLSELEEQIKFLNY